MKILNLALLAFFSILMIACPAGDGSNVTPTPISERTLSFSYWGRLTPVEAGIFGEIMHIVSSPPFLEESTPKTRAILGGPGSWFYEHDSLDPDKPGIYKITYIPYEEVKDSLFGNGMYLLYRPPSHDDVPPEGVDITFACEVLSPFSGKWERSPTYTRRVVRRDKPMDFYIAKDYDYGPDVSLSHLTVKAGDIDVRFGFYVRPWPLLDDPELEYGLVGLNGYTGNLGKLEVSPRGTLYAFGYTPPDDITSPVDIAFKVSINDPWAKERRERVMVIHVLPKD